MPFYCDPVKSTDPQCIDFVNVSFGIKAYQMLQFKMTIVYPANNENEQYLCIFFFSRLM